MNYSSSGLDSPTAGTGSSPAADNLVVLLHAIEMDTGAVPTADVELAKRRMTDFKRRLDAAKRSPPRATGRGATPPLRPGVDAELLKSIRSRRRALVIFAMRLSPGSQA